MAKAAAKGILLGDYIKFHAPEPLVRTMLDRGELRYEWVDADGRHRASDDGGPQPPPGWWLWPFTKIDRERREVSGNAVVPTFFTMFFVKVFPVTPAVEHPAQEAPRRGRPSSAPLVLEEAERRLQGSDRARHIQRGRDNLLAGLSDWLRETPPEARPMAAKTIGDHLRANANVQALLPEAWLRRK
jgi:hypothetical protein